METPDLLPARLFLLAYDPAKERLTSRTQLPLILRAAALAELSFAGRLVDEDGKVRAVDGPPVADPVLAAVFAPIAGAGKQRKWQHWVQYRNRKFPDLVRDQLDAARVIRVEKRRYLGFFTVQKITLRDPRSRTRLAELARRTLRGGEPVERLEPREAATVAMASAGGLATVVSRKQRREFKRRIDALNERSGPALPALRKAISNQQATMIAAGG
jgi:hypothetical protein